MSGPDSWPRSPPGGPGRECPHSRGPSLLLEGGLHGRDETSCRFQRVDDLLVWNIHEVTVVGIESLRVEAVECHRLLGSEHALGHQSS